MGCLDELISLQLQWKWEQLCGTMAGWPLSSPVVTRDIIPHCEKRLCHSLLARWLQAGRLGAQWCLVLGEPGHVLTELTSALDLSPSVKGLMTNPAFLVTLRMFWELPEGLQLCLRAGFVWSF